jgi:anti-anti-sigma factor
VVKADYLMVETTHHGPVCVLAVTGELDLFTVANLAESAAAALKTPAERFVLDLSGLRFIDCCGARALAIVTQAVPADCPVIVRSVSPAVRRVMDLIGVNLELREMTSDSRVARLTLESQRVRSLAQQAIAESRTLADTVAATEDRVADTLTRLADRRPHRADRLAALSHAARTQAAHFRGRARDPQLGHDRAGSALVRSSALRRKGAGYEGADMAGRGEQRQPPCRPPGRARIPHGSGLSRDDPVMPAARG